MNRTIKIAATLLLAAATHFVHAQEARMTFKQTEIKGTAEEFFSALESKGFTRSGDDAVTGLFAGHSARVSASVTPITGTVYQVTAELEDRRYWKDVEADYLTFKKNLTLKYGEPAVSGEGFELPYFRNDGHELKAVSQGKVTYMSSWMLPEGLIIIRITGDGRRMNLTMMYTDNKGIELHTQEETQTYLNDL